jgi:hypothetical protein
MQGRAAIRTPGRFPIPGPGRTLNQLVKGLSLLPGLPIATQGETELTYFAGRNATWSSSATPAAGWNE